MLKEPTLYKRGEILFLKGDVADDLFIIDRGRVELWQPLQEDKISLSMLQEGDLLGEEPLMQEMIRGFCATAHEDSLCYKIPKEVIHPLLSQTSPLIRTLLKILINTHKDHLLKRGNYTPPHSLTDKTHIGSKAEQQQSSRPRSF